MKYILQTDNETIEIPIIRSKRKTLGLEVKYDGTVNARVPMRAPREIIERFIREHEAWIIRKRQEWSLAGNNQDDVAGEFGERKKETWGECGRSVEDSSTGRNERRKSEDQTIYRKAS